MPESHVLTHIRTPRLLIVSAHPDHAEALYKAKLESMDHLYPWMVWADKPGTLEDQRTLLAAKHAEFLNRGEEMMMLAFTHEGEFVVATGYPHISWRIPKVDIGYWCRKSALGQGYVTEAANALTRYGFEALGMRKIVINVDSENIASEKVALRLNMALEYEEVGGITTLHEGGLRTKRSYCCFDTAKLPPLDVTWD